MYVLLAFAVIAAFAATETRAQPSEAPTLESLLSRQERTKYERYPDYRRRMEVFTDALKRYSDQLRGQVEARKIEELLDTLHELQALAHYALEEDVPVEKKDRRSGQVKKLEIKIRKLLDSISDAKSVAPYEYHEEFQQAVDDLGRLRARLLKLMFGTGVLETDKSSAKPGDQESRVVVPVRPGLLAFDFAGARTATPQDEETRYSYAITGDQFTEKEYEKIRDNQDLGRRVDVFLAIAEARLNEIRRRMNNEEWTEKEPNPLEFYTYEQMIHAYERALNSMMINIDEKATHKLATPKQIKKSLEKLNQKIMEFTPQLAPIKELAEKNRDEILYREILEAEKTSEIARKGSLYGLGAPVQ
jgi:hypothetical protein